MAHADTYNCPFCFNRKGTPDTKGHLYFYGEDKGYHCFRCGAHASRGAPPGAEVSPSVDMLAEFGQPTGPDTPNHLSAARPAWGFSRARRYLMERGISAETAEHSMILYAPVGWLRQRVIFPIYDSDKEISYYVARDVTGFSSRKYLNAPWGKNGLVYPVGSSWPTNTVVVVEGVFDAFAVDRAGWQAVSLLGKRINAGQARTISRMAKRAAVLLDADAYASALEVSYQLGFYLPTRRVELPRGKDPDSFARADLRALLGKAMKEWADAEEPKEAKLVRS